MAFLLLCALIARISVRARPTCASRAARARPPSSSEPAETAPRRLAPKPDARLRRRRALGRFSFGAANCCQPLRTRDDHALNDRSIHVFAGLRRGIQEDAYFREEEGSPSHGLACRACL